MSPSAITACGQGLPRDDITIGDSDPLASPHGCAATAALHRRLSSEGAVKNLQELPIAARMLLEARAIVDNGFRRLAYQS
jgi:hypothetical protein